MVIEIIIGIVALMVVATVVFIVMGNKVPKIRIIDLPTQNPIPIIYWSADIGACQNYIDEYGFMWAQPLEIITYNNSNYYCVVVVKENY